MIEPLSQRDSKWKDIKLGTSDVTIEFYGCTITDIAMAIGKTPDFVNSRLLEVDGYAQKNLVIWAKLPEAFPQIKSATRITHYDNQIALDAIEKNGCVMVEVDGSRIGASKHWVLYVGDKQMNDPWFGNTKATNYYRPIGMAVLELDRDYVEPVTECEKALISLESDYKHLTEEHKKEQQRLLDCRNDREDQKDLIEKQRKEIESLKEESEERLASHKNFVQNCINELSLKDTADEIAVLSEIKRLVGLEHDVITLETKVKQLQTEKEQLKRDYEAKIAKLQLEVGELRARFNGQLDNIEDRLEAERVEKVQKESFLDRLIKFWRVK